MKFTGSEPARGAFRNSRKRSSSRAVPLASGLLFASSALLTARAQEIHLDLPRSATDAHQQRVSVDESVQTVTAGRPDWLELHFHVAPGFHINSHTPHDETLIATSLNLPTSTSYRVIQSSYPAGEPLRLAIGAGETLSTYSADFRVRVQVFAAKGDATLVGSLHYQACTSASCFPARDLPLRVPLAAR